MTLLHPAWLILILPLWISFQFWKIPSAFRRALRIICLLSILLALCGLSLKLSGREGLIVIVADRSSSMPMNSDKVIKDAIDIVHEKMPEHCRMAVVAFGEKTVLELPPSKGKFGEFNGSVGKDGSNLNEALEKALSLIPRDTSGRVLVLSDGRWTRKDPKEVESRAAVRKIALDFRKMDRPSVGDIAVDHIDSPQSVIPRESFLITVWIRSPVSQTVDFAAYRDKLTIVAEKREVPAGLSRVFIRDKAGLSGVLNYTFKITGKNKDPVPENNTAKLLIGVVGHKPILLLSESVDSGFFKLLSKSGLPVQCRLPHECSWSLEELGNFSAVIIENVAAQKLGYHGMGTLAAWVSEIGGGLMMTGGKRSYGPGGYFKSALDPILPVSMELRSEHRKLSLSICIVLDRSGSMAMSAGGGRTKMDMANLSAVQVLDLLSPMDELGVIAVDSSPHVIAELGQCDQKGYVRDNILSIDSMGGGIFVYEGLVAAADMLSAAKSQTRHIILFADAADAEHPGEYRELLEKCRKNNMTVSVIGMGEPTDGDADFLRDVAARGNGRIFFTADPEELPRLFAQDTFVAARSTFLEQATTIQTAPGLNTITTNMFAVTKPIGGYNLCYLRPGADLGALTVDEYKAPIVAAWSVGIGRALCFTGEADGQFSGSIVEWPQLGGFYSSLVRWTAGSAEEPLPNSAVTQETGDGICRVTLHLDPQRENQPFTDAPKLTTLRSHDDGNPTKEQTVLEWNSADSLSAEFPLQGGETLLSVMELSGKKKISLPPICLPYSSEFKPDGGIEGIEVLEQLAAATGGKERIDLSGIWQDLPKTEKMVDISPYLLLFAIILFFLEVLDRRMGLATSLIFSIRQKKWSGFMRRRQGPIEISAVTSDNATPSGSDAISQPVGKDSVARIDAKQASSGVEVEATSPALTQNDQDMVQALKRARNQVRRREGKDR